MNTLRSESIGMAEHLLDKLQSSLHPQQTPWPKGVSHDITPFTDKTKDAGDHAYCWGILVELMQYPDRLESDDWATKWIKAMNLLRGIESCRPQHLFYYLGAHDLDEELLQEVDGELRKLDFSKGEVHLVLLAMTTLCPESPLYEFVIQELLRMGAAPLDPRKSFPGKPKHDKPDPNSIISKSWQWRQTLADAVHQHHFDVVEFVLTMFPCWVNCCRPTRPPPTDEDPSPPWKKWRPIHQVAEVICNQNGDVNKRACKHLKWLLKHNAHHKQVLEEERRRRPFDLLPDAAPKDIRDLLFVPDG
eukprot:TRINITY_DN54003_c0_g1_i1.p1 TRINITY_DN54003_c0_g1~~TRINITY_DN54003_c0_g1_i1.p1  ORF type:complete len:303 (+),score=24.25 TRINITY_DN54003_c0_g1_i1:70-978(+)